MLLQAFAAQGFADCAELKPGSWFLPEGVEAEGGRGFCSGLYAQLTGSKKTAITAQTFAAAASKAIKELESKLGTRVAWEV